MGHPVGEPDRSSREPDATPASEFPPDFVLADPPAQAVGEEAPVPAAAVWRAVNAPASPAPRPPPSRPPPPRRPTTRPPARSRPASHLPVPAHAVLPPSARRPAGPRPHRRVAAGGSWSLPGSRSWWWSSSAGGPLGGYRATNDATTVRRPWAANRTRPGSSRPPANWRAPAPVARQRPRRQRCRLRQPPPPGGAPRRTAPPAARRPPRQPLRRSATSSPVPSWTPAGGRFVVDRGERVDLAAEHDPDHRR